MVSDIELGWLAGTLDGEGSVGISRNRNSGGNHSLILAPSVQMSTTCKRTCDKVLDLLTALGCVGRGYTYQEKKPERHLPSHHMRVTRLGEVLPLTRIMAPITVTKQAQWRLLLEFCELRLDGATVTDKGTVTGGRRRPYEPRELTIAEEMSALNQRGPR